MKYCAIEKKKYGRFRFSSLQMEAKFQAREAAWKLSTINAEKDDIGNLR
jgi:hypothetical protein